MNIQIDFWQLVGLLVTFLGACGALALLVINQIQKRLDGIEQVNRDETIQWQRVEREMLRFQADLPMKYVMRDDYIRGQTLIEAKLDGIAGKFDNAQLRARLNEGSQ